MKILRNILVLGVVASLVSSCSENEYKVYDTTQKDSVFFNYVNNRNEAVSEVEYAFNYNINNTYTITVPILVMGSIKNYDRPVSVTTDPEVSTMVEGTHYEIVEAVVPAGATEGVVRIKLIRDRDPQLLTSSVTGRFVIAENEGLHSVKGSEFNITFSDIRNTDKPDWWISSGTQPVFSFDTAQLFFDYFHRLAPEADLDIYNEIVKTYGEYFEDAQYYQGPWTMYPGFFRNYVFIPLHREHPEIEFVKSPEW